MDTPPASTEEEIYNAARALTDARQRSIYLDAACRGNPALRRQVDRLLEASNEADAFFDRHAVDIAALAGPEAAATVANQGFEGPGTLIGRYKLLQRIGEGGFGSVYMAEQKEPVRRRVALKIIKLGMDTRQVVARFEAERQALAMMDHPNIARVLDGGCSDNGRPFFVMELVKGSPITTYCDEHKLSTVERLEMFIQACQAIQHAHQKGIVHRDIKPSNILVASHDGKAVPKVIDFGIAKAMQYDLTEKTVFTQFQQFMGTPAYMSPEQASMDSTDIDTRSDIYALGVLLYELLTGVTPLAASELTSGGYDEMRRKIREIEPPRPSNRVGTLANSELAAIAKCRKVEPEKLGRLIRGDLDWIILKAIDKDRSRRYETANGLALDVRRFLNNEPVTAVKPSMVYLAQKFAKRHRAGLAAAASIAVLLATGTTVSTAQAIKARNEAERARRAEFEAMVAQQNEAELRATAVAKFEEAERLAYTGQLPLFPFYWEKGNFIGIREGLASTAEAPFRSFEWGYWNRMTHLEESSFPTYADGIRKLSVSPDRSRVVLVMNDNSIEVRKLAGGELVTRYLGHLNYVADAVFSPDGRRVASCGGIFFDGLVKIWDAGTGAEIASIGNDGDNGQVDGIGARQYSVSFSPDGRRLATGGADQTIRIWDATTGWLLQALGPAPGEDGWGWVRSATFTRDGGHVVFTAGRHEMDTIGLLDLATGRMADILAMPDDERNEVQFGRIAASPVDARVAAHLRSQVVVFDLSDASLSKRLCEIDAMGTPAFSPDGSRLVVSHQGIARVFDAATGEELAKVPGTSHGAQFLDAPDHLVSTNGDRVVESWRLTPDLERAIRPLGHSPQAISRDGTRVLVHRNEHPDDSQNVFQVLDARTGEPISPPLLGHAGMIDGSAFSSDGRLVVTGSRGHWNREPGQIIVRDAESGAIVQSIETGNTEHYPIQFGAHDATIVSKGSGSGGIAIWDIASGDEIFSTGGDGAILCAASPDGRLLATSDERAHIRVWDLAARQVVADWTAHADLQFSSLAGHSNEVLAFAPDGVHLFTAGGDGLAKMWAAGTGELIHTFRGHRMSVTGLRVSPDGQRLLTYSMDGTLRFWDVVTGRELLALADPSLEGIYLWVVAMSPDGGQVHAASKRRNELVVWKSATDEEALAWREAEAADAEKWDSLRAAVHRQRSERRERGHAEHQAALERMKNEPPSAPGSVKDWLVLAPLPIDGTDLNAAMDAEQVAGEAQLRPRATDRIPIDGGELAWQTVSQQGGLLDLNAVIGTETRNAAAYAACYVDSESERRGVKMRLSFRTGKARVYLNGREVFPAGAGGASPIVDLKAGRNVIVLKLVVGDDPDWRCGLRFDERPTNGVVPGLRFSLDPGT